MIVSSAALQRSFLRPFATALPVSKTLPAARHGPTQDHGFKFGRWTDGVFLQRGLSNADAELPGDGVVSAPS
ncbi:hypothetical protein [Azospirillum brasilense]|uniref:Uncharacterized protein n=1 Tax=Azospirillum brasilense TaxID=192 RepID=A0A235HG04_AZOBR|nr:hypothetical protein [Azospirillum brasilense]OYD84791.1 hypothetical protein CHT98_07745 [Azospirillum brasilense]